MEVPALGPRPLPFLRQAGRVDRLDVADSGATVGNDGYKPDGTEKALRFGCSFLFIAPIVFFLLLRIFRYSVESPFWPVVISAAVGGVAGIMATGEGDGFWERLADWLRWLKMWRW